MIPFLIKRLITSLGIILSLTLITFLLIFVLPSDPARSILGVQADKEAIESVRRELKLDQPLYIQYLWFLFRLSKGDLGRSYATGEKVIEAIGERIVPSFKLIFSSALFSLTAGVLLGILMTYLRESKLAAFLDIGTLGGASIPIFLMSILFAFFLGFALDIFPMAGYETGMQGLKYLVLPVLSLSMAPICMVARVVFAKFKDIVEEPFMIAHEAYGFSSRKILFKYGLKNTLLAILSILTNIIALIMGSAIFAEYVFSFPGVFSYSAEAIFRYDTPIIQGTVLLMAIIFVLVITIVDVSYAIVDPRVSIG